MSFVPAIGSKESALHQHDLSDICPLCEQPIAAEQRIEIWERITARQHQEQSARALEDKRRTAEAVKNAMAQQGKVHADQINILREELRAKEELAKTREAHARQKALKEAQLAHQQELQKVQTKQ